MFSIYTLFKFLHVTAVIVWLGGASTLAVLNLRLLNAQDKDDLQSVLRANKALGIFLGPSALLTLIAGVVMVANARIPFSTLWIVWGLGGIVLSIALGGSVIRRTTEQLYQLATAGDAPAPTLTSLQRRLVILSAANLALLFSIVWAMVAKPVL